MQRTHNFVSESAVEKDFDTKKYSWHKYTSERGVKLVGSRGRSVSIRKGDLFGVKEFTTKEDKYLILKAPDVIFKLSVAKSDKLMEEKAKEYKGKTPTLPKNPPKKIKIDLDAKPAGKIKKVKPATDGTKAPKAAKPKLTANQKKIAAVKAEIKRLQGLKQNTANIRKIAAQKAELKKLNAKEKAAQKVTPKTEAKPKAATPKSTKPEATKPAASPTQEVPMESLPTEVQAAKKLLDAIDSGGMPLNPAKLNAIGRELGMEISSRAQPEDTIKRIRDAVQRAIEFARAEAKKTSAPVNPVEAAKKTAKPSKVKIDVGTPIEDEDGELIPTGSVRYGGKIIEPEELDFDDDLSGIDLPIPESWSSDLPQDVEGDMQVTEGQSVSKKRPIGLED